MLLERIKNPADGLVHHHQRMTAIANWTDMRNTHHPNRIPMSGEGIVRDRDPIIAQETNHRKKDEKNIIKNPLHIRAWTGKNQSVHRQVKVIARHPVQIH